VIELTDEMRNAVKGRMGIPRGTELDPWMEAAAEDVLAIVERDYPATEYTLSALPEDNINARLFSIKVAYRGSGRWAVLRMGDCLSRSGEWDYESIPSERTDGEAMRLAREALPGLTVNGLTAAAVMGSA
jgi:hypothetical protein